MQTSLMFVDLKPLGVTPNSQKIAIKMPAGAEDIGTNGDSGFSDMINALMAVAPEELQNSFGEMEWVKVQGESAEYAPLLDLSGGQANETDMAKLLFGELAQNNLLPSNPLDLSQDHTSNPLGLSQDHIAPVEEGRVGFVQSNIEQLTTQEPKHPLDFSKGTIAESTYSTKEGLPDTAVGSNTEELSQNTLGSGKEEDFSNIKTIPNKLDNDQKISVRSPIQVSHYQTPKNDNVILDSSLSEDTLIDKESSVRVAHKAPTENSVVNPKNLTASTLVLEEATHKSVKPNDAGVVRVTTTQNDAKVNLTAEQQTNQQFGERNDHNAEPNLKRSSQERQPSEAVRQNFNLARGESTSEVLNDDPDPLSIGKQDNKAVFHQVVSRLKGAPVQSVEYASGHHESAPQTSDTQSNVIRQIVQRMSLHNQGTQSTMTLKLKPAFLGNVHMQISTDNQQVVVRMATESAAVKEMVEQGLQHLKSEMQHHGLEIDKFEVFVANDNEESRPGKDLAGFRQALKQRQQNAMKKGTDSSREEGNEISEEQVDHRRVAGNTNEIDYFA